MITGALPFLRNKGCFEVFYWTHLNYISFSIIYVLHASSALYWFLLPGLVFMTCKLQTILRFCLGTRSDFRLLVNIGLYRIHQIQCSGDCRL